MSLRFKTSFAVLDKNDLLEEELKEAAANWSVEKRLEVSEKLARWADQLFESAASMNPSLAKRPNAPSVPRGFFLLNLATWEQKDLRKLAHESGTNLRTALSWAITKTKIDLREKIKFSKITGLKPFACWQLSEGNPKN